MWRMSDAECFFFSLALIVGVAAIIAAPFALIWFLFTHLRWV